MFYWIVGYKIKYPGGYSQKQFRTKEGAQKFFEFHAKSIAEGRGRKYESVTPPAYMDVMTVRA